MLPTCAKCGLPADQRCSRCHVVYYCNGEHQREHWNVHREACSPYKVGKDAVLGRFLMASRDLPEGAVLLREAAVATGPPPAAQGPLCVACYRPLPSAAPLCPRGCGWPVCDARCAASPTHRPECALTAERGAPAEVLAALAAGHPVHRALTVARCLLLRESAPAAYERLLRLEAHCERRRASGQYEEERTQLARFMLPFFGLEGRFTEEEVLYMAGVLQINTYPVRVWDPPPFVAIYEEASFIEHTCVPNTVKVFGSAGELLLRTAAPVRQGDHLSISYANPTQGTAPRRQALHRELLQCACRRCKDPTEMGTNFSALTCSDKSCLGAVLPENPLSETFTEDPTLGGPWRCSVCGRGTPGAEATALVTAAEAVPAAQRLARAKELRLGSNHYLLLHARVAAACDDGATPPAQRDDVELRTLETELRALLRLIDTLLPGEAGLRGRVQFALYSALLERELRRARADGASKPDLCALQEAKHFLEEAVVTLADHSEGTSEGALYRLARSKLDVFENIIAQPRQPSAQPPSGAKVVSPVAKSPSSAIAASAAS